MRARLRPIRFCLLSCALSLASCVSLSHPSLYPLPGQYRYAVPQQRGDGLETGPVDPALFPAGGVAGLEQFFNRLKQGAFGEIHSVLLVHRGKLVVEEYFPGYRFYGPFTQFTAADRHHLASVTKSLTSLCVGIAIDKGLIRDVDEPFLDFYRDVEVPDREAKHGITLRHLLTMTAGLEWDEWTYPYTDLLGDIVRRASGLALDEFALKYLYEPLGITDATWITLEKDFIYASGDAELRPRDMAKIGMLVLGRGAWQGKRVVSERWIDLSMEPAARADPGSDYGFMWWLPVLAGGAGERSGPVYLASGWGDQYIAVAPRLDLVAVITAGNYEVGHPVLSAMLGLLGEP